MQRLFLQVFLLLGKTKKNASIKYVFFKNNFFFLYQIKIKSNENGNEKDKTIRYRFLLEARQASQTLTPSFALGNILFLSSIVSFSSSKLFNNNKRSITKLFTTLLVGVAVDRGLIASFDAKLADVAPEVGLIPPPVDAPPHERGGSVLTWRQVLSQQSGLQRETPCVFDACAFDSTEMLARISATPLQSLPWTTPIYSNLGFALVGNIVAERVFHMNVIPFFAILKSFKRFAHSLRAHHSTPTLSRSLLCSRSACAAPGSTCARRFPARRTPR